MNSHEDWNIAKISAWVIAAIVLCSASRLLGQELGRREGIRDTVDSMSGELTVCTLVRIAPGNPYFRAPIDEDDLLRALVVFLHFVRADRDYSGSGLPLVSGANGSTISPTAKIAHIVTPAYRHGSGSGKPGPAKTFPVSCPSSSGPDAATNRPTL